MKKITNECCGCATPSYPCTPNCPLKEVAHYFCDDCGTEIDHEDIPKHDGDELCPECLEKRTEE